ncbi:MAG: polysaccharide biosynthesis/export family protein [Pirellulaceae bacterium]
MPLPAKGCLQIQRALATLCLSSVLLAATGCHQGQIYQASGMPLEFMAPRLSSIQNVDLSRLARSVGNSELVYPGDVIEITIATGVEKDKPLTTKARVAEDGNVTIPLVGPVQVAGLGFTQAEQIIRDESIRRGKFVSPNVSVILDTRRTNRVTVVGAVEEPGTYELPSSNGSDVLNAIVFAKGFAEDAGTIIEIRHPPGLAFAHPDSQPTTGFAGFGAPPSYPTPARTVRIDLEQASLHGSGDFHLEDGSTVMVMKRGKRFIHVIGLVKKADQFEMPEDQELRLLDALALAGGRTLEIADTVHIVRQVPNRDEPVVIKASVREAKRNGTSNIRLAAGDVVSVEETPLTFTLSFLQDFIYFGVSSSVPLF